MSPIHCAPQDSVRLFKDIKAKKAVGMHWATWILTSEDVFEPPQKLKEEAKKLGVPDGDFRVCDIGETLFFHWIISGWRHAHCAWLSLSASLRVGCMHGSRGLLYTVLLRALWSEWLTCLELNGVFPIQARNGQRVCSWQDRVSRVLPIALHGALVVFTHAKLTLPVKPNCFLLISLALFCPLKPTLDLCRAFLHSFERDWQVLAVDQVHLPSPIVFFSLRAYRLALW